MAGITEQLISLLLLQLTRKAGEFVPSGKWSPCEKATQWSMMVSCGELTRNWADRVIRQLKTKNSSVAVPSYLTSYY